jgi:hypothetical protein
MEEQEYYYQLKPLLIPGGIYLISYPILAVTFKYILKFSTTEFAILAAIYLVTLLGIAGLWIYARSKRFRVEADQIILTSLKGEEILAPEDIRRIALFRNRQGQEVVQIKTRKKDYYLSEFYFPFPELMSELEQFIKNHEIRTNFTLA